MAEIMKIPVLITTDKNPENTKWLRNKDNAPIKIEKINFKSNDEVKNFTLIFKHLSNQEVNHALLIGNKNNLPRKKLIRNLIAGSKGIRLTSIPIQCNQKCQNNNSNNQIFDYIRTIGWITTGKDLKPELIKLSNRIFSAISQGPDQASS